MGYRRIIFIIDVEIAILIYYCFSMYSNVEIKENNIYELTGVLSSGGGYFCSILHGGFYLALFTILLSQALGHFDIQLLIRMNKKDILIKKICTIGKYSLVFVIMLISVMLLKLNMSFEQNFLVESGVYNVMLIYGIYLYVYYCLAGCAYLYIYIMTMRRGVSMLTTVSLGILLVFVERGRIIDGFLSKMDLLDKYFLAEGVNISSYISNLAELFMVICVACFVSYIALIRKDFIKG